MTKILIAGLPGAGKSTYIGALAYTLEHPAAEQSYKMAEIPEDSSTIKKLYKPWLSQTPVDRTIVGSNTTVNLLVEKDERQIDLLLPDIAGEDFERLLQGRNEVVESWSGTADGLIFMIKDLSDDVFMEALNNDGANQPVLSTFTIKSMSTQVKNIVLIKELCKRYKFKKVIVAISAWDSCENNGKTPEETLRQFFPTFFNFLSQGLQNIHIIGVSAQGAEYKDENKDDIEKRTNDGTRAYIVCDHEKVYDLSIPISFLVE